MNVVALKTLREFWTKEPRAERPLQAWYEVARKARWATPAEINADFGTNVDFLADNRVIFDLGGNKYRLVVRVSYRFRQVMIKFVGTHQEYDRINPETV
jgi:mRNA interferase HigB